MTRSELRKLINQAAREGRTELDLRSQGITELPRDIGRLNNLEELDLSCDWSTFGELSELNQLTSLPREIGQLTALRILNLSHNELVALPSTIGRLAALQTLELHNNKLSTLPPGIGNLSALQTLDLHINKLKTLPWQIGQLTTLKTLDLSGNQLTELPAEIGQLTALQTLDLHHNRLAALPPEIVQLTNLRSLNLRDNPDFPLPPEISEKTNEPQTIIRAYLDYLGGPKRLYNEAKLVLVGEGSVGKTSIVCQLLYSKFDPNPPKTDGIAIHKWEIEYAEDKKQKAEKEISEAAAKIKVNVWDFGGQEILHATHQFFLTERTLYILVLNNRLSENANRLDYWLTLIHSFGGDSPILVVGNRLDEHPLSLNRRALLAKYPTVQEPIHETSCRTGVGIPELRTAIIEQIARLPYIADPLADTWLKVKMQLEAQSTDYISYTDYVRLCRASGVDHPNSQRALLSLLHDLGVVLHFPDPRLVDTIFNPEWVTQGVYRILNTRVSSAEPGILTWNILKQILNKEPYQEKCLFIMDMMQKFELCYELPDRPHTYLIPDLLPKEEPDTGTWDDAQHSDTLRFEVHYPVLPGSILTRLIVRMHRHIHTVWRTGVLLACEGNESLVKADLSSNHITIAVRGPAAGRRELLARIREHLGAIHTSLVGLQAAEKVPVPGHPEIPPVDYKWLRECERRGLHEIMPEGVFTALSVRQLLDGVEMRGRYGSGLPGEMIPRLRETLLHCGPFDNADALHTLFVDERLYPWRNRIPDSARNAQARVDALVDALLEQSTARGESVLALLLRVLTEKFDSGDACHLALQSLANELT